MSHNIVEHVFSSLWLVGQLLTQLTMQLMAQCKMSVHVPGHSGFTLSQPFK